MALAGAMLRGVLTLARRAVRPKGRRICRPIVTEPDLNQRVGEAFSQDAKVKPDARRERGRLGMKTLLEMETGIY